MPFAGACPKSKRIDSSALRLSLAGDVDIATATHTSVSDPNTGGNPTVVTSNVTLHTASLTTSFRTGITSFHAQLSLGAHFTGFGSLPGDYDVEGSVTPRFSASDGRYNVVDASLSIRGTFLSLDYLNASLHLDHPNQSIGTYLNI